MIDDEVDELLMASALEEAVLAGAAGDVPVGAVVALIESGEPKIIGRGRNRRELVNEALDEYLQATQGRTLADVRNELAVFAQRKQQRVERDRLLMAGW